MQYLNKTKTIDAKCEIIINKILVQYSNGEIKTELEMLYKLKHALKEFYSSVGKPTFKATSAKGTPVSFHFNVMIEKAYNDLEIMINECKGMSTAIESSFVDIELSRKMLSNKINYIDKKLNDIKNKITINNNSRITSFSDSFINLDYTEIGTTKDTNIANINTTDGVLTLAPTNVKNLSSTCKIEVLNNSNGFPGNTHMIDVLEGELHFIGNNNLHINLNDIIDDNIDTWFEYEIFKIDDKIKESCNGFGFEYKENVSWITENDKLKLVLKLILAEPNECNWLNLTPFMSDSKASKASTIIKVTISDGNADSQCITTVREFNKDVVIMFTPQIVSHITIEFEQNTFYETSIGHYYFVKNDALSTLVFDDIQSSLYNRIEGEKPSVESLGMKYDPSISKCIQPKNYSSDINQIITDTNIIKSALFTTPASTYNVQSSVEILKAYRYFIGIKNISISNYQFTTASEYISKPFTTNDFITSITLESDELIPKEFDEFIDKNFEDAEKYSWVKGQWIKYAITFNDGVDWEAIWPKHRAFQGPCTFKINSDTPVSLRKGTSIKYVNKLMEPSSVKIKINLQRPVGEIYKTPLVFQYKLNLLIGDENIEH